MKKKMDWTNTERIVGPGVQRSIMDLRTSPLQLEDVVLDLETVEEQPRHGRLNVKGLILNCVQAALSMVKDKFVNSQRETERVSLVLKLLHQDTNEGHLSFLRGVCRLIAKLLREKESKTHTANMAQHWLINEAASNENINKAGTFRRSCLQTLEGKVSPILAGIIAYLDTNENLSILEDNKVPWKQKLWLTLLNTTDGLNLQLTDLLSPERKSDLQEVYVTGTGCEGHIFRASMPFSWLVISQISEILRLPKLTSGIHDSEGTESRVDSAVRVLHDHPLGRDLADVTAEESVNGAVQNYIQDFVHTMYYAASEQEHQLVVQSVYYVSNQIGEYTSLLQGLIHVHIAYETLAPRLTYFRAMNSVWPECSSVIIDLRTKHPDHFMFKEKEFTFSTLCLLIENLTPKVTDLNNQQGRSKWLSSVHKYRSVVEKVISLHGEDPKLYGEHTFNSVRRARNLWSRVMVVKLFLEHVCTTGKEDKITIKHCMPLWTILGEETDLKEIGSLSGVEKFLKSCNKQAMKEYIGSEEKCCHCELVLEGPPITLPCKDVVCDQCYDGMRSLGENMCAKCHKNFPKSWEPTKQAANKKALDRLKDYQKRCNTFFMDIVSQLCFAENTPPSQEVVNKLLGYIFFTTRAHQYRTRNLTIFDTGLDPNPVFRSFLLQLLMRTSEDSVMENLGRYLQQAVGFIKGKEDEQAHVELSLLVIQCLEDMFTQEASRADTDEVQYATQALYRAKKSSVEGVELTVQKLYGIASARTGLAIAAKYIADIVLRQEEHTEVEHRTRKLIEAAQNLCDNTHIQWYRVYLVKYLCRRNGIDVYQALSRKPAPFLRWISFRDTNREQVAEVSDRYIVCGDSYISLRESVTKVVLGEDAVHLVDKLQELHTAGIRVEPMLQLALHREVTISNIYPNQSRKITARILQNLDNFVGNCQLVKNKQLLNALVHNQLVPRHLVVYEGEDLRQQGIQCLIVHFLSVMAHLRGDLTLLQPIMTLIRTPQAMQNAYLPTMPQDDLEDVKEALLAARNQVRGADNNPVFYRCPNGHPYVIGDCGRPYVVARCKCGAEIGGQGHQLLATNRQDTGTDTTQTGHLLGRAQARGRGAQPERQLTPAYCSAVRMLLHLALYLGAGSNRLGVQSMIKPNIGIDDVEGYVWDHIMRDLDDLHIALGLSVDDVMLLMHSVIDNILRMHNEGEQVRADISHWNSKPGRREWENAFSAKFLQVIFQDLNNILKTENQRLAHDKRLGADPLLCLLYETDTKTEAENAAIIEQIPRVWRYRTPISLQHLRQEVQAKLRPNQYKVLQLFLQEEHNLRAMRYIPSILRLHRALFQKYQRKLDKAEASQIKVAQLRKDEVAGQETNQLLHDYAEAWELVRRSLDLYLCPTEIGGTAVSKEYCTKRITDKTPIAMLLPTMKEAGLCSYALLDFLLRKQNDFLDKYLKETQRKPGSISSVQPREVTFAHLISYDPQHDIQPLILANCQYSFEMGKGTKIEYDFAGLERQLMDRFLFSKSRIDVGRVLQIDLMIYRTEFTNAEVFRKLSDKIPQETLGPVVKNQISGEFRSTPDLFQSLDNLDITISFLKSTGGPSDRRLHDFMLETLQMESSLYSQKAQQVCEFRHAQSLWLLLSLQKSKRMTDSRQSTESTFESVSEEFHKELPADLYAIFKEYALKKLSVEKLTQLVEVLHEYILLVVAVRQNRDEEDYTDTTNNKLCEWLQGYVDGFDSPPMDVACLADFPKDILYEHSVHTWVSAYKFLKHKQTGNYSRY